MPSVKTYTPKDCAECGTEFPPASAAQKFCSIECRDGTAQCVECGTTFIKRRSGSSPNCWCSADCRWAMTRRENAARRRCAECGSSENLPEYKSSYCYPCTAARTRSWAAKNPERAQESSRASYYANKDRAAAARKANYLANRERDIASVKRWQQKNRERHLDLCRKKEARRRARKKGNGWDDYDRLDVYERDGGFCGICGLHVRLDIEWPDPEFFSIDHIKPISAGGPDTFLNVQTAHLACNMAKGPKE